MSDLLFPIFLLPWDLADLYVDSQWLVISGPLGQALCKLVSILTDVSSFVSIQSLILIAVDRFGAVVFPLRSPLISSKLCPFFILTTWIVALAVYSPYLVAFKLVEEDDGKQYCYIADWNEVFGLSSSFANYLLALNVVFFNTPIALLVILYSVVVIKLKSPKIPGEQSVNAEQQRNKRNRNVLKMAIAIVVGSVLCWVPFSIIVLLLFFARELPCGFWLYESIAFCMACLNCAITCICFIFSSSYRRGLQRLLKCFNAAQGRVH